VYEVQDLFPNIDISKIHESLALHNYDTQKCIEYLFNYQINNDKTNNNNNNIENSNNEKTNNDKYTNSDKNKSDKTNNNNAPNHEKLESNTNNVTNKDSISENGLPSPTKSTELFSEIPTNNTTTTTTTTATSQDGVKDADMVDDDIYLGILFSFYSPPLLLRMLYQSHCNVPYA
jgi:CUE domain